MMALAFHARQDMIRTQQGCVPRVRKDIQKMQQENVMKMMAKKLISLG